MQQETKTHQSVERSLEILMAFTPHNREMGASEVSEIVGLHRSTVSRLLQVLARREFLIQNPGTKKYSLGKSAAEIGRTISASLQSELVAIAQPHIDALRDTIPQENVGFEVLSGNSTVLAYRARGTSLVQISHLVGDRLPVHVAAGAKAILAFLPHELAEVYIPKDLARFTPNTITDREELFKQLTEFRETGIAIDRGERDIDVHVIAAPVFNYEKKPVAAVVISTPSMRKEKLTQPDLIHLLKETAAAISRQLLY